MNAIAVNLADASAMAGISLRTLRRAIDAKEIPVRYVTPRRPVVLIDDLRAWIEAAPTERNQ